MRSFIHDLLFTLGLLVLLAVGSATFYVSMRSVLNHPVTNAHTAPTHQLEASKK